MEEHLQSIKRFVVPFYANKDIMHDLTHIERIEFTLDNLAKSSSLTFDSYITKAALSFHGIIYSHEEEIKLFLTQLGLKESTINKIVTVAWESQKENRPTTNEGLLLHDAHMLEGGINFEIIKSLITGSVRGQSLEETMIYIETHLLNKGHCYTDGGIKQYEEMKKRTLQIYQELNQGLGRTVPNEFLS